MKQLQTSHRKGQEMTAGVTAYFIPRSTHLKKPTDIITNSAKGQVQLSTWPVPLKEMVCSTRLLKVCFNEFVVCYSFFFPPPVYFFPRVNLQLLTGIKHNEKEEVVKVYKRTSV